MIPDKPWAVAGVICAGVTLWVLATAGALEVLPRHRPLVAAAAGGAPLMVILGLSVRLVLREYYARPGRRPRQGPKADYYDPPDPEP